MGQHIGSSFEDDSTRMGTSLRVDSLRLHLLWQGSAVADAALAAPQQTYYVSGRTDPPDLLLNSGVISLSYFGQISERRHADPSPTSPFSGTLWE